jgi:hypothetical protein
MSLVAKTPRPWRSVRVVYLSEQWINEPFGVSLLMIRSMQRWSTISDVSDAEDITGTGVW